jgi:hypothetical protein
MSSQVVDLKGVQAIYDRHELQLQIKCAFLPRGNHHKYNRKLQLLILQLIMAPEAFIYVGCGCSNTASVMMYCVHVNLRVRKTMEPW